MPKSPGLTELRQQVIGLHIQASRPGANPALMVGDFISKLQLELLGPKWSDPDGQPGLNAKIIQGAIDVEKGFYDLSTCRRLADAIDRAEASPA